LALKAVLEQRKSHLQSVGNSSKKGVRFVIEQDELKPLVEKEAATNWLSIVSGAFLAIATFVSISSILSIIEISQDDTIPLVVCPEVYDIDSPVLMKTVSSSSPEMKDKWIKGFVRRFLQAQFPRSSQDAEAHVDYVLNHSKGNVKSVYKGYMDQIVDFKGLIDQGFYYAFYPNNTLDVRIRSTGNGGEWAVEIDGFMVRTAGSKEERTTPTLNYVIKTGDHTMKNPEGLYVTESNIIEIADYVSGRRDSK
jgi:hypothetical protein